MFDTGYGDFEFERKFLVRSIPSDVRSAASADVIVQSYFLAEDGYALRVRLQAPAPLELLAASAGHAPSVPQIIELISGEWSMCMLTAKGPANGGTRYEAERELDPLVAEAMVLRGGSVMAKLRYSVWLGEDGWVLDEFVDENAPLIVAECERGTPVTDLVIPQFCVTEVSEDPRFGNENLANAPYSSWQAEFESEIASGGTGYMQSLGHNRFDRNQHV